MSMPTLCLFLYNVYVYTMSTLNAMLYAMSMLNSIYSYAMTMFVVCASAMSMCICLWYICMTVYIYVWALSKSKAVSEHQIITLSSLAAKNGLAYFHHSAFSPGKSLITSKSKFWKELFLIVRAETKLDRFQRNHLRTS